MACFSHCFFLLSFSSYLLELELWYLASGPNEAQALDVSLKKFSERQKDREEVDLFRFREKCTLPTEESTGAMECGMASFGELGEFIC